MSGYLKIFDRPAIARESPIIRYSPDLKAPVAEVHGLNTPAALLTHAIETHGDKRAIGFRKVIDQVGETYLLGDWQYYTYNEVGQRVREIGAALKKLFPAEEEERAIILACDNR